MMAHPGQILAGKRVLVLEDEVFISMMLVQHFQKYAVDCVDSFTKLGAAVERAAHTRYDLAVLDIRLPDGESFDLARKLIADGCRVVFHSGHGDADLIKEVSASVFCRKPSSPQMLNDAVSQAFE